ncbi:MAG: glutamyl-tRNA reductase [Omnitrophica bacterium RIFCSPHIGHO2_02_FULL_51_18]|nr:MAG: glutamyl-tRNA reductase [Omnitrophica bacterium RIFCSPHIGHO2_02_FULL_51_18]
MEITVLGLNHKTAPLEIRERLSIPKHKAADILKRLEAERIFDERVLLSTCNRTELYGVGRNNQESVVRAKKFLSDYSNIDLADFENNLYVFKQPDSVEHLFSVASGLDSMVLGETEILGQVKDAYLEAHKIRQTGKVLNTLFQRSLKVAKNLRTHTDIGAGKVSVASVAVELAEKIFENLRNARVMIIGTGEMAGQVGKAMVSKGAKSMIVSHRHLDRAEGLAQALGGEALSYEAYEGRIKETDILITSTLAPFVLIQERQARAWMRARHEKPLFIIDIAVPRNVDAAIEKLDNVYLYNVDDLKNIADQNLALRKSQLEECFRLIHAQTQHFMGWLSKERFV